MTPEHDETLTAAAAAAITATGGVCAVGVYSSVGGSRPRGRCRGRRGPRVRPRRRAPTVPDPARRSGHLVLRTPANGRLSPLDARLAARISAAVAELGLATTPRGAGAARPVQALEIAIDALDIPAVLPFWRAVFGYVVATRPIAGGDEMIVVDPAGQGPPCGSSSSDAPRPQRNRIHFDLTVAEDEAEARIAAALAAGGRLVSDAEARAFWILADPEGNEVCICTWQDRD